MGEFGVGQLRIFAIPAALIFVIPAPIFVIPAPSFVIPATAGIYFSAGEILSTLAAPSPPTTPNPLKGKVDSRCGGNDKGGDGEGRE